MVVFKVLFANPEVSGTSRYRITLVRKMEVRNHQNLE